MSNPTAWTKQTLNPTRWTRPVQRPGFLLISGTTSSYILQANGYKLYYTR